MALFGSIWFQMVSNFTGIDDKAVDNPKLLTMKFCHPCLQKGKFEPVAKFIRPESRIFCWNCLKGGVVFGKVKGR